MRVLTREKAEKEIRAIFTEPWADGIIKALEQEPFINKPCVSEKPCEHDKNVVLDKIRADIIAESFPEDEESCCAKLVYLADVLAIIEQYKKGEVEHG